jgi:hypothetical protein
VLASLYFPILNPIGPSSLIASAVVFSLCLLTNRPTLLWEGGKRVWTALTPGILLLIWGLTDGLRFLSPRGYCNCEDHAAIFIYTVFGFAFSLKNFQYLTVPYRANAVLGSILHGSIVATDVGHNILVRGRWDDRTILVALVLFGLIAVPNLIALNRKAKRRLLELQGLCHHCGYNLTGNVSGVCPECGNANAQQIPGVHSSDTTS